MNSRERLLGAIKHTKIDRVPINTYELCGFNFYSFENNQPSYYNLMHFIRTHTDTVTMWNPGSNEHFAKSSYPVKSGTQISREGEITIYHHRMKTPSGRELTAEDRVFDNVNTTWHTEHWCKNTADVDALLSIPYESVLYNYAGLEGIKKDTGDHGIVMTSIGDPACIAMELMEFGAATVWALTETDHFASVMAELHQRNMANLENMLKGGMVDLYRICGPEYITPPYLPPRFFERFVLPYVAEMTALIHQYGGLVRVHCHGKIGRVLSFIRDIGADALDPCEAPPDGDIELADIKQQVGDKMCLFGNLQLKLLENGTAADVRSAVKLCMDSAKGDSGYVIMPTASPINEPLSPRTEENYRVFIETALELGEY